MTFSIQTLSVIIGCAAGILTGISLRNPFVSIFVAIFVTIITETVLRIQSKD